MQPWVSCNVQPGFYLSLHHSLMSFYFVHSASTFINIPNMCACLYNTAELHYSNSLNRVINLQHVSLPCVPSSGSAVHVVTVLLPPSHPPVSHTWAVSRTLAVIPMRSAAVRRVERLLTSAFTPSSLHLLQDDWHSPGFWEMASPSFPHVPAGRLLCSSPDSWSGSWVDRR